MIPYCVVASWCCDVSSHTVTQCYRVVSWRGAAYSAQVNTVYVYYQLLAPAFFTGYPSWKRRFRIRSNLHFLENPDGKWLFQKPIVNNQYPANFIEPTSNLRSDSKKYLGVNKLFRYVLLALKHKWFLIASSNRPPTIPNAFWRKLTCVEMIAMCSIYISIKQDIGSNMFGRDSHLGNISVILNHSS